MDSSAKQKYKNNIMKTGSGKLQRITDLLIVIAMIAGSKIPVSGQVIAPTDCLPPLDTMDAYTSEYHVQALAGLIELTDVVHYGFGNCSNPPYSFGDTINEFFSSKVAGNLSVDGGQTFIHVCAPASVWVWMQNAGVVYGTRLFNTEMIQLNMSGGDLPPGYMIRESPTLTSTGLTTIKGVPGAYTITSYFNIYIEFSNNNGAIWVPADSIAHVELKTVNFDSCFTTETSEIVVKDERIESMPNPFTYQTTFTFNIAHPGKVLLEIYNAHGIKAATLFDGYAEVQKNYSTTLEGNNLQAGIYIYKLITSTGVQAGKVVLTR